MAEDTQPQTTEGEVTATEPSLDDVISEYNVPLATQPETPPAQAPVQQPVATQQPVRVDPLDESSFNSYVQQVNSGQSVLNDQLQEVKTELTNLKQERAQLQVEADINSAVETLNEGLNLDPKLVRVHLEYTAQQKPGFKSLWENRHTNPQAYEKAMQAVGREMRDTYSVRTDENLTETQTAIQKSQQSLASSNQSPAANSLEERLAGAKTQAEFDRIWAEAGSGAM